MEFPDSLSLLPHQRRAWAECLGRVIAYVRQRRGLSAAEAARLAGMETAQWETIEDGKPTLGTPEQFQAMAEILGIDWGVVRLLVSVLCIPFRAPYRADGASVTAGLGKIEYIRSYVAEYSSPKPKGRRK